MIKRFYKNKPYTLCLIKEINQDDFDTWCVNVIYHSRIGNILEFHGTGEVYTVDTEFHLVTRTYDEFIYDEEGNPTYIESYDFSHYTNIVQGWQY